MPFLGVDSTLLTSSRMMKEILFPVFMSVSALSLGCSEQGFRAVEGDTNEGVGEVTPLPDASASGETFLEACGTVSSAFAPLDKRNDFQPEEQSLAAIDAYNSAFAGAVEAELAKMPVTEFLDAEVPITIGFYFIEGSAEGYDSFVYMNVAIGDLSGAWQSWVNAGSLSVESFFHHYYEIGEIERFIACKIWTSYSDDPSPYDWDAERFGSKTLHYDQTLYQPAGEQGVSIDYNTRVIESDDSGLIGDTHYVTDLSGLLISHGIRESDVDCDDGTTCTPSEDFVEVENLVLATTHGYLADTMESMLNLATANVPEGEPQALVVTQIGVDSF